VIVKTFTRTCKSLKCYWWRQAAIGFCRMKDLFF